MGAEMDLFDRIEESVAYLEGQGIGRVGRIALVLGSGLGSVAEAIGDARSFSYDEIPHFKASGAPTHKGRLVFGTLEGREVVCMQGRIHLYEGYTPGQVTFPLYVLHALGADQVIFTNATGGIRADLTPGDIVAVTDHINFTGQVAFDLNTSLPPERRVFEAFVDMTDAYTPALIAHAHQAADVCGIDLKEGVYVGTHGPQLETPAEIRVFRAWGADVVGMSTVLEVIAARAMGMDILCLSFVSNVAAGLSGDGEGITSEGIFEVVTRAASRMEALIRAMLAAWPGL